MTSKLKIPWSTVFAIIALTLMGAVVVRSALSGSKAKVQPDDIVKAQKDVPSIDPERVTIPKGQLVAGNGIVEPVDRETKIAGDSAGRIVEILVKEGDVVEQGAVLLRLDDAVERAAVLAAEAEIKVVEAELMRTRRGVRKEDADAITREAAAASARAKQSSAIYLRTVSLTKGGAATEDELDRAKRQAEADEQNALAADARRLAAANGGRYEDVVVAQSKVKSAEAKRQQMQAQLDTKTIRAPFRGTVLQSKYRVGERYSPEKDPLFLFGDTSRTRARIDIDERDIAKVKIGANAFITLISNGDKKVPGKVIEVGHRMGRKNVRTDDPVERIDTKILEVVLDLQPTEPIVPGLRVVGYVEQQ